MRPRMFPGRFIFYLFCALAVALFPIQPKLADALSPPKEGEDIVWDDQIEPYLDAMAEEIALGKASVRFLDANFILVRFERSLVFIDQTATLKPEFNNSTAKRLAAAFRNDSKRDDESRETKLRVFVIGHTAYSEEFLQPEALHAFSERQARVIVTLLRETVSAGFVFEVRGRGPDDPICTPASSRPCFAANRRIDLLIERREP